MNSLTVRPIEEFEYDSWDRFVEFCPGGTIYHTSLWKQVVDASYEDGVYCLAGVYSDDQPCGGYAALMRNRLGVKTAVTPLLTPYCGFVLPPSSESRAAGAAPSEALLTLAKWSAPFRYQHLQCPPHSPDLKALAEAGYTLTPRLTLEINLSIPEEELWAGFAGQVRRNIKKAQRAGLEISENWDDEQGFALFRQTFEKHGQRCEVPEAFFREIASGTLLRENRRRFCAWSEDTLQAYIVAIHFGNRVYYQIAAANANALGAGVPSLLIWELIRACKADGFRVLDFVGGNTPSIAKFKQGFNPTAISYVQAQLCSSRRLRVSRGIRDWIRKR